MQGKLLLVHLVSLEKASSSSDIHWKIHTAQGYTVALNNSLLHQGLFSDNGDDPCCSTCAPLFPGLKPVWIKSLGSNLFDPRLKTSSKILRNITGSDFVGQTMANICKLMQLASQGTSLTLNLFPCKVMTSTSTTSFCSLPLSEASPMAHGPGVGTVAIVDWKFAYWQVNLQRINVKKKILIFCLDLFSGNHIDLFCRTSVLLLLLLG